jgi:hypothetical protein
MQGSFKGKSLLGALGLALESARALCDVTSKEPVTDVHAREFHLATHSNSHCLEFEGKHSATKGSARQRIWPATRYGELGEALGALLGLVMHEWFA